MLLRLLSTSILLLVTPCLYATEGILDSVKTEPMADPVSTSSILQLILVLLLVVGLILFAAWFFRRVGQFGVTSNRAIRYLGGLSVGQRERIVLIEVGDTQLLIGVAPGRVSMIHKLDVPVEVDTTGRNTPFARKLAEIINKRDGS